jgi:phosphate starvation-inducible PhoH-like protein
MSRQQITTKDDLDFSEYVGILSNRQIKRLTKQTRRSRNNPSLFTNNRSNVTSITKDVEVKRIEAKTEAQYHLIDAIERFDQTITIGSAGTGKTYVSASIAAEMLISGKIEKIIITRPNVPTGRSYGAFPGSIEEKLAPWLAPITSVLKERLGVGRYECMVKSGKIQVVAIEVIRGSSFKNSFVMVDEAQNLDIESGKAVVTRMGDNSKLVLMGDITQKDLPDASSGLKYLMNVIRIHKPLSKHISIVEFTSDDIVRSDVTRAWVKGIEKVELTNGR